MERGAAWGTPTNEVADYVVTGSDADLAANSAVTSGALIAFSPRPPSDFARTLGLDASDAGGVEVAVDVMAVHADGRDIGRAVNAIALGTPPHALRWMTRAQPTQVTVDERLVFDGRATGVVVASGQYLHDLDVNPRSHPGDGVLEVLVFGLRRGERGAMRRRLATGTHVPHPRIQQRSGTRVAITAATPWSIELDAVGAGRVSTVHISVSPASLRLLL